LWESGALTEGLLICTLEERQPWKYGAKVDYKNNNGVKPKVAGKVFVISGSEVATSDDPI